VPCRYAVLNEGRLVVELWWGTVHSEEIVRHEAAQLRDRTIAPGAVVLADLRPARFPREEHLDVPAIAATHGDPENVTVLTRCALLTNSSETFFLSKLIQMEMAAFAIRIVVFASLSTACTWLGCDPALVEETLDELAQETESGDRSEGE